MLRLASNIQSLKIALAGPVSTIEASLMVCASDQAATTYAGKVFTGATDGATLVDLCPAPSAGAVRDVDYIGVRNGDTAVITLRILFDTGAGPTPELIAAELGVGELLTYTHASGWAVNAADGTKKTGAISGALLAENNLFDLDDPATARQNIGLEIGADVQAHSAALDAVSGTNTGDQLVFKTIAVSGQSNVVADGTSDTLTLAAGSNITITTDASTDTVTIAATGGAPGGSTLTLQGNVAGAFAAVPNWVFDNTTGKLAWAIGTITASSPWGDVSATVNSSGTTFNFFNQNITKTAAAAASTHFKYQTGASDRMTLDLNGRLTVTFDTGIYSSGGIVVKGTDGLTYATIGGGTAFSALNDLAQISSNGTFGIFNVGGGLAHLTHASSNRALLKTYVDLELSPGVLGGGGTKVQVNNGTVGTLRDVEARNWLGAGNLAVGTVAKSADYTATTSDCVIAVDASGAARTITGFACASNAGKLLCIKKTDSSGNSVTFDPNASELVDGASTKATSTQYAGFWVQVNAAGTAWNVVGTF